MEFFICDQCDGKQFKNELGLLRHLNRHGVTVQDYRLQNKYKGIKPLCKCGCNKETKWGPELSDFRDYIPGHQSRVNNNFTTEKSQANSKATRAKMKEEGTLKGIASEELRKGRSERMKGSNNIMFGKQQSEEFKANLSKYRLQLLENNPLLLEKTTKGSQLYWETTEAKESQRVSKLLLAGFNEKEIDQYKEIAKKIKEESVKASVYLINIEGTNTYKIGFTKRHPFKRVSNIQTNIPQKLQLLKWMPTNHGMKLEKALHNKFSDKQLKGEWFQLDANDIENFEQTCQMLENALSF